LGNVRRYLRGIVSAYIPGWQARSKKPAQMAGGRADWQADNKKPAQKAGLILNYGGALKSAP
jgi:hypothetical protein